MEEKGRGMTHAVKGKTVMEESLSANGRPDITLSIVSHGDSEKIPRLLESLFKAGPNQRFQILLTDNLGEDLPEMQATPGNNLSIIRNPRPQGFARNHNEAFRRAETDLFCVLNPDVLFTEPIFDRLITLLETAQANIVAPLIVDPQGTALDSFRRLPKPAELVRRRLPGYHFSPISADPDGLLRPDWIAGTFLLLKCETYRKINGFDEKFRLYFEDVDFSTRARLLGLKLLVDPGVQIQHDAQRTSRRSFTYLLWHLQSAVRFYNSAIYRTAMRQKG